MIWRRAVCGFRAVCFLAASILITALYPNVVKINADTAKPFRVIDAAAAVAAVDIFPGLNDWAPPASAQTVYTVYQDDKQLGRFLLLSAAVNYAKRYSRAAVAAEGLIYNNSVTFESPVISRGAFAVYQQTKLLRVFGDYNAARAYADLWENNKITGFAVVWHNYDTLKGPEILKVPYEKSFARLEDAVAYAKSSGLARPAVIGTTGYMLRPLWELIPHSGHIMAGVPWINQLPELQRGCEVTSLAMMLNFLGVDVDKMTLAENIRKSPYRYDDPNNGFIGDIYTFKKHGLGVYHAPIAELASRYMPGQVIDATGLDFEDLLYYIDNNRPVWVVTNSRFTKLSASDYVTWQLNDGTRIKVTYREHAVLITGYDDSWIYIKDPLNNAQKASRVSFIEAWEQMGSQAVTIVP